MRMTHPLSSSVLGLGLAALALSSVAQTVKLPEPRRTGFKCEHAGKVTYWDAALLTQDRLAFLVTQRPLDGDGAIRYVAPQGGAAPGAVR